MKKLIKKVISFALAVVLVMSTFAFSAAAADVALAVSLDKSSCMQGDTFVATIYFPAKFEKAAALDLELTYDQTKVDFVKLEKGAGLNNALNAQLNGKVFLKMHQHRVKSAGYLQAVTTSNSQAFLQLLLSR